MKFFILGILVFVGGLLFFGCLQQPPIVGNDSDGHGCKLSAGYSWCEEKQKCIRPWEENCTVACTMEAKLCPDGSAVGRTGPNCEFAPCPNCSCPTGYRQEGDLCTPECYYANPPCLAPSIKCINNYENITNFEQCAAAGYPILESYPAKCRTPDNRTFTQEVKVPLTAEICQNGGGHWDECGSACRGAPEGTACTLQCVQYCECGGIAGFICPEGYYCTDYIPEDAADAMGICKPKLS